MSQQKSANLALPYIQPAQAQKHVTHNEAIRVLDALVQASTPQTPRNAPPGSAAEGLLYVVGGAPTGAWEGHAREIAWRTDGAWSFIVPRAGWALRVLSTGGSLVYDGANWVQEQAGGIPEQVTRLGISATADDTNRLALSSDATLFNHAGAGHQLKINKDAPTDTASLMFQTAFGGRAEMGTAGSDDFAVNVSADGAAWTTGISVDSASGVVAFPSGVRTAQRVEIGGRITCATDLRWVTGARGTYDTDAGTGAAPALGWRQTGAFVAAGTELRALNGGVLAGDGEVTGLDLEVYLQWGPWATGWADDADTTRLLVWSGNADLTGGQTRIDADLGGQVAATDAYLVVFARPVGTLTAEREVTASLALTVVTPD